VIIVDDSRKLSPNHFCDIDVVIDFVAISNDTSGQLFQEATMQIKRDSRIRSTKMAK
jgi:hypothetical protein